MTKQLAYYHRNKGSEKIQANRDRYNAKRRGGRLARGKLGPRRGKTGLQLGRPGAMSDCPFPLSFAEPSFA